MESFPNGPRVTARHLRADDDACARRIVNEMRQYRGIHKSKGSNRAFDVAQRIASDVGLAHTELRAAMLSDFPKPHDLSVEECRAYEGAAHGYVTVFPEPFNAVALADSWESVDQDTGNRWIAPVAITGHDSAGTAHVRDIKILNAPATLDQTSLAMIALRTADWATAVVVDAASLLSVDRLQPVLIDSETRDEATQWARMRAARWTGLGPDARPKSGRDCNGCPFVTSCPAHQR